MKDCIPSLADRTIAMIMYERLKNVETPSQTLKADKWGTAKANMAQTKPAIAIQYGSFRAPSSLKRT